MKLRRGVAVLALLLIHPRVLHAQPPTEGVVTGIVTDASTRAPLENANLLLRSRADSSRVFATTTLKDGAFLFPHVPPGAYVVECSLIGHTSFRSPEFVLGAASPRMDLRTISLKPSALLLDEVVITSERSLFNNSIDRRVYNVDHDLMAKSSSVSDLLQNIPSVQVDVDGGVSLRGSPDVMILINGKKSPLMGKSRADVLQQLPAATIEKIEVITNPSARFTPEGTSGIINIVTRKGAGSGVNGDVTGHVGTASRSNENLSLGYRPGKLELFVNYSHRDDRRKRIGTDARSQIASGSTHNSLEDNQIAMRPRVHLGTLGLSYHPDPKNTLELSSEYFDRRPSREGLSTIVSQGTGGAILSDYDRRQSGYESEQETGGTAAFEHDFPKEDHNLRVEANVSDVPQTELANFVEHWRTPAKPDPASTILLRQTERQGHVTLDYADPVDEQSKLEAGYALEVHRQDIRSDAESLDVIQQAFRQDLSKTYRFKLDQAIHAVYGTYERSLGKFSVLGGLRAEYASVRSDLVTGGSPFDDKYSGLYPTLHMAYQASERGQVQLNYSRRIRRPESDDLNPFPEYTDPYNIDSGNPRLKPESIHSYELGYRLRGEHFSLAPTIYYRDRRDGFTRVTQAINDSTFLRTMANLASDRSAGLEPVVTMSVGRALQANLNGNVFYDQIDASNIGYAGKKSVVSWSGTFNATVTPWTATAFELNSNYRSARLTPQGDSRPSFGLNVGARQNLFRDRVSVTVAVSDLLKTQRQETRLDVSGIQQRVTNKRDAQIVYAGVTYHYGRPAKDEKKEKGLQWEDAP
jgi:outer membrane receptor protein involved in Fe transport